METVKSLVCDALVIGASLEGCIAAAHMASKGKKVVLIENSGSLGQAATNGLQVWMDAQALCPPDAQKYKNFLLQAAGESEESCFYHDQKMKLALQQLLNTAGVKVYTHVFACEAEVRENSIAWFRLCGKTGYIDVTAAAVIDATDSLDATSIAGIAKKQIGSTVRTSVKCNRVDTEAIEAIAKCKIFENDTYLFAKSDFAGIDGSYESYCTTKGMRVYHNKNTKEFVLSGISVQISQANVLALSSAQAQLRQFSYKVRDRLRDTVAGFAHMNIIHVAPRIEQYGLYTAEEQPLKNLYTLNHAVEAYDNVQAIVRGVAAAEKVVAM